MKKPYKKIKDLDNAVNRLEKILLEYGDQSSLSDLKTSELSSIIYNTEKVALSCRQAIEDKEIADEDYYGEDFLKDCVMNLPTSIEYEDKALRIKVPLTFKRMFRENITLKENYVLINYVTAALKNYTMTKKDVYKIVGLPLVAIIKRTSTTFTQSKMCDNDNLENGRIINKVMTEMGYSDNVEVMDIYSCFRVCDDESECGVEFIFAQKNDYESIINALK